MVHKSQSITPLIKLNHIVFTKPNDWNVFATSLLSNWFELTGDEVDVSSHESDLWQAQEHVYHNPTRLPNSFESNITERTTWCCCFSLQKFEQTNKSKVPREYHANHGPKPSTIMEVLWQVEDSSTYKPFQQGEISCHRRQLLNFLHLFCFHQHPLCLRSCTT